MKPTIDRNQGTTAVRPEFGFDEVALERWMGAEVSGFAGPMQVEQFKGGQSNPTYRIATPGQAYVLRRKPPGELLKGAHAIEREALVIRALGQADFPVARLHAVCEHNSIIGTPFYIMECVEGRIFWDASLSVLPVEQRAPIYDAMNATIARLHNLNYAAIGLEDFGRAGNYFERQIARWTKQYLADTEAGRDEHMDRLLDWLPRNIPEDEQATLVHGDYRLDNIIFHPTEPEVLAVIDWELATLGSPLSDFVYSAMTYRMPPDIVAGLGGSKPERLGLPTEQDYVDAYCRRTGRSGIDNYPFYMVFNFFRLAAIFHGIRGRVCRGTAVSAQAVERAEKFPELARIAWASTFAAGG